MIDDTPLLIVGSDSSQNIDISGWKGEIWAVSGAVTKVPRCDVFLCRYNVFTDKHIKMAVGKQARKIIIFLNGKPSDKTSGELAQISSRYRHVEFVIDETWTDTVSKNIYGPYKVDMKMAMLGTAVIEYALARYKDVSIARFSTVGEYHNDNGTNLAVMSHVLEIERNHIKTLVAKGALKTPYNETASKPSIGKVLTIITAREGSKGVPMKNMRTVNGIPLLYWTVAAARNSSYEMDVVVSTDGDSIADYCRNICADVPFMRPKELSQDNTPSVPVLEHAVAHMEKDFKYEYIMLLQPTSPLRTSTDIDNALKLMAENKTDAVISISESPVHPQLLYKKSKDGKIKKNTKATVKRRQDRETFWWENGAIYIVKRNVLMEQHTLWPSNMIGYEMTKIDSIDIDDETDLMLADSMMKRKLFNK